MIEIIPDIYMPAEKIVGKLISNLIRRMSEPFKYQILPRHFTDNEYRVEIDDNKVLIFEHDTVYNTRYNEHVIFTLEDQNDIEIVKTIKSLLKIYKMV